MESTQRIFRLIYIIGNWTQIPTIEKMMKVGQDNNWSISTGHKLLYYLVVFETPAVFVNQLLFEAQLTACCKSFKVLYSHIIREIWL